MTAYICLVSNNLGGYVQLLTQSIESLLSFQEGGAKGSPPYHPCEGRRGEEGFYGMLNPAITFADSTIGTDTPMAFTSNPALPGALFLAYNEGSCDFTDDSFLKV